MDGLTEGRIVHLARPNEVKDHCLAAIVTRVFEPGFGRPVGFDSLGRAIDAQGRLVQFDSAGVPLAPGSAVPVLHPARQVMPNAPAAVTDDDTDSIRLRVRDGAPVDERVMVNLHVFKDGAQQFVTGGGIQQTLHVRGVFEAPEGELLENTFHDPRNCPRLHPEVIAEKAAAKERDRLAKTAEADNQAREQRERQERGPGADQVKLGEEADNSERSTFGEQH